MPLVFTCPSCGHEISAPDNAAGQSGRCKFCGATVQAPASSHEPATLIQPGVAPPGTPPGETPGTPSGATPPAAPPPGYTSDPGASAGGPAPGNTPGAGYDAGPSYAGSPYPGAPYPGAPGYAATGATAPTGDLNFANILSTAWDITIRNIGLLIGAVLVVMAAGFLQNLIASAVGSVTGEVGESIVSLLISLILIPLQYGLLVLAHAMVLGQSPPFGLLFSPYQRAGTFIGVYIVQVLVLIPAGIVGGIAFALSVALDNMVVRVLLVLVAVLVAIFLAIAVSLAPLEVIDKDAGIMEAVQASWAAVTPCWLSVFGVMLGLGLVALLGLVACGIGIVFTAPLAVVGQVLVYRALRGLRGGA